jgi:hypothetical protein
MQGVGHQGEDVELLEGVKGHEWHPRDVQCDVASTNDGRCSVICRGGEPGEGATGVGYANGPVTVWG